MTTESVLPPTLSEADYDLLSEKGLFIVGNARSGTTIFCESLNVSNEIYLFQEANFFLNHARNDFVEFFNAQHEGFKNSRAKGTYIPLTGSGISGLSLLTYLAQQYRYVGEKIAFGPKTRFQELFFEFHAKYFLHSHYFLIIRRPDETVWSMSKMWPSYEIESLLEAWLRTVDILLQAYQFFPKAHMVFWENFSAETITRIGQMLGVEIALPEGMISKNYKYSSLERRELPGRLVPFGRFLEACDAIYAALRDSFSPNEFTYTRPEKRSDFFRDIRLRLNVLLRAIAPERGDDHYSTATQELDSGERFVPDKVEAKQWGVHASRYLFASNFVQGKTVLDAECGTGYGSQLLLRRGAARVVGVDIAPSAVAYAHQHYVQPGLEFQAMSVAALGFRDKTFDVVIMLDVLEHVSNQARCLAEISRVLKDDGLLVVSTPNQAEHPGESFNPFHVRELNRLELIELLQLHFQNIELYACGFSEGMFVLPMEKPNLATIVTDTSLLTVEDLAEPPFFISLCSQVDLPSNNLLHRLFPFTLNRGDLQAQTIQRHITRAFSQAVRAFMDKGEFAAALPLLETLHRDDLNEPEWNYLLAFCLHQLGREWPRALKHYELALTYGFDEFWVRYNRGSLHSALGNCDAACADLERAVELQPAFEPARNEYLLALAQKARRLIDDRQFEAGLQIVKRLLHIQPQHPEGNYLAAFCFHKLGKEPDKALQHYEIALAQGFDEFWARYNRGSLQFTLENYATARDDLERATVLQPEHPGVRELLAQLHAVASDSPTTVNQAQGIGAEVQAILRDLSLITIPDSLRTFSPTAPDNFEIELYNGIRLGLKPGKVMFELGTYCGVLTVLAARIAGDAQCVVLFEASPVSAARAQAMAAANGLPDIKVINAFVSDRSGALQDFYLIDSGAGAAVQSADPTIASLFPQARKVEVPTLTLDEWLAENGLRPDLIKIDIEGAEFLALKGMQNLLVTSGPDLILELHGDRMPGIGGNLHEMYALLSDAGYEFLDLHSGLVQSPAELLELYPIYGHIFCSKALADPASRERVVEVAGQMVAQQNALKRLNQLVSEARQLVDQHEFSRARVLVEELLASWGNHPEGNYLMAYVLHMLQQDPERALWHYAQALQLGFAEFWVRYNRASLLIALGRPLQAMPDLERAAALGIHQGASELLSQVRQSMARTAVSSGDTGPAALQHRARHFINKLRGRKV